MHEAPLAAADLEANPLTALAAAGVPGVGAATDAETAGEVMRAALAAEAEELEDLRQKVNLLAICCENRFKSQTQAATRAAMAAEAEEVEGLRQKVQSWTMS